MRKVCVLFTLLFILVICLSACNNTSKEFVDLSNISMEKVNDSIKNEINDNTPGTHAIFYKNSDGVIFGFMIFGHSGYAESGSDIVCSAVSTLTYHSVNSIKRFTNDKVDWDEKDGYAKCFLTDKMSKDSALFMESTAASMEDIHEQYSKYFKVKYIEIK